MAYEFYFEPRQPIINPMEYEEYFNSQYWDYDEGCYAISLGIQYTDDGAISGFSPAGICPEQVEARLDEICTDLFGVPYSDL